MSANPSTSERSWQVDAVPQWSSHEVDAEIRIRHLNPILLALSKLRRTFLFEAGFLRLFRVMQAAGVSILPNHYYWPVPDLRTLEGREWKIRDLHLELNLPEQDRFMSEVVSRYQDELDFPDTAPDDPAEYHRNNGFFETIDAEVAYCMVRDRKPKRIIEVGGGYSTRLMATAVRANAKEGVVSELTTVEPYPDPVLSSGIDGVSKLLAHRVQDVPIEMFESLEAGDILFIDSSHVVTVGSDVVYEFFEIFPRLKSGVIIHLHDIFYPADYPRDAVLKFLWFWSEQYLLEALLGSNSAYDVLWASSAMQLLRPHLLEHSFPRWRYSYGRMPRRKSRYIPTLDGKRVWPSSFWMKKR